MKLKSAQNRGIDQYKLLYERKPSYGQSSHVKFEEICLLIEEHANAAAKAIKVIDFGCGKSSLIDLLEDKFKENNKISFYRYDPAIEEYSKLPIAKADFLINTDVLEHIYPEDIAGTLEDFSKISDTCYLNISTRKAHNVLENGENAHATVRPANWWLNEVQAFYPNATILTQKRGEVTISSHKASPKMKDYFIAKKKRRIAKKTGQAILALVVLGILGSLIAKLF